MDHKWIPGSVRFSQKILYLYVLRLRRPRSAQGCRADDDDDDDDDGDDDDDDDILCLYSLFLVT